MSNLISVVIDGKKCQANDGEFILNIARANDIFIPAICYLTRCSPTLACRLCLVEANGKQVYSCNAKAKDGMIITTSTQNIEKERTAIMEVYDVNHPLQCGVCDQSGECELQDYNIFQKIKTQSYTVKDVNRPTENWGVMSYDPGLCIVCEKCVTVCKDMIGSNALSTVKRGADALNVDFKTTMPKDAYAMWNKLNKGLIGFQSDKCTQCGECIAVCPVGAMASSSFKYTSNAWELTKIPASNPYTSDCALIYYEIKHNKIYRVTNDSHYVSLNGATRFAFDYSNNVKQKNKKAFKKVIKFLKDCDTIKFNSYITNEEAFILQNLKEKLNIKLINNDALSYKKFLQQYSTITGESFYNGTLQDIHNSNFLISVGSFLKSDTPNVKYAFSNAIIMNKGAGVYFHPMGDKVIQGIGKVGKNNLCVETIVGSEEAILYFILDKFGKDLPDDIAKHIKDISTSKLLKLFGGDDDMVKTIDSMLLKKDKFSLIIGEDCITHKQSLNIARLCGLIEKYTDFKVIIVPTCTNTLGVSLLCDLDENEGDKILGYNENIPKNGLQISALGDGDLDMPTLNQQEGTFVNIDKKVIPTNVAISYDGYVLNDIANEILGKNIKNTIDYTDEIFEKISFDSLDNFYTNDKKEHRGYSLKPISVKIDEKVENISEIEKLNEQIIYKANQINQFNEFTAASKEFKDDKIALFSSSELLEKLNLDQKDKVLIKANNQSLELDIVLDIQLSGNIAYIPYFDKQIDTKKLFDGYRFNSAKISKIQKKV